MEILLTLLQLFGTFFVIGLFTIGGGYAMLSLIQGQVVVDHAWMSESAFTDIVAISQMTPGPIGINCATYVGYDVIAGMSGSHLLGIVGSLVTTLALVIPSFIIMLLIVRAYTKFNHNPFFEGVMSWLRPAVVGLIGAAAVVLLFRFTWDGWSVKAAVVRENIADWKSWLLLGGAFVTSYWGKVGPIAVIILAGIAGFLLY
ncbi:MAG: chromate transporter [Bacteroidales bacterium]|nr:chromate transporter [Bacteroidales bacterium]